MVNDYRGKAVLITGGTKGIGLATGLAFGRQGAECTLTSKWGSADEAEIRAAFAAAGAPEPHIVEADVADNEDTQRLLADMKARWGHVEAFISNVGFGHVVKDLDDYALRSLFKSIEYSAWPMIEYTRRIKDVFGKYPRYVIGLSSGGPDHFHTNYDFIAASKAVLETFCKYLNHRLFEEDIRINVLRPRFVKTDSLRATMGDEFEGFVDRFDKTHPWVSPDETANAILGLCSGLMDGVSGQVVTLDHGASFSDNLMRMFAERSTLFA
ncbi:MAG: hypothetical protein BGO98_19640 [Myxococcales bacterium 68-20]|nr:SDR family oxidoreductase [Myxococcales bacterium]OJY22502.1 MAG: hypothetical protein BGO98_19640 [Myxococcales bacterium 68-20]